MPDWTWDVALVLLAWIGASWMALCLLHAATELVRWLRRPRLTDDDVAEFDADWDASHEGRTWREWEHYLTLPRDDGSVRAWVGGCAATAAGFALFVAAFVLAVLR